MKRTLILFSFILLISCNNDEEVVENAIQVSAMKYTVAEDVESFDTIYSQEYTFDSDGKVLSETFTNYLNPQFNYKSTFEYNNQGKLIKEIRNGQIFCYINWNGNVAELYNESNQKISDFKFNNENLIEYNDGYINGNIKNHKYNYDTNGNVVSIENQNEVFVEYLNYNKSIANPMNLIKSIGVLRLDYKPYFKNFFAIEKAYPYEETDYTFPLTHYGYQNTLDSNNRIITLTNNRNLIYKETFEYN
ncbi:hypothetical protein [Flavobacterium sp. MDT1-60]|uniref:hypothetical protein n=1 Tax=Flavobacterium sp. MDT1-60 TaxID=1979344 RepID=UPI00177C21AA|nr:hypothetical protein [Flavobacterium sp. MDT1-60]QOG04433.1 hypothetical protein IHE43_09580 [Flavobacterium sp. MDT1-60]